MGHLKVKRVYEGAEASDGLRILVDRLWPRGVKKEQAGIDLWLKDVAPSPELRKWFGHRPERFEDFGQRYREELAAEPEKQQALADIKNQLAQGDVTLVYAAKDTKHNHVIILKDYIEND
ncbi:DUF488 domain-containing protein [Camelliibacillus cellulosilyticus]|uniref:DUF488 domain-containing protein n=1 Tax=Camelliibacillus cellulosilyticus TaxID=2174486 RepID=A0ABV9GJG7_9BACL